MSVTAMSGILKLDASPGAQLRPVPASAVQLGEGFWLKRLRANCDAGIPAFQRGMEEHGFFDNFRRAAGRKQVERRERYATDADVFKWLEAVAWSLTTFDDAGLRAMLDETVELILAAQGSDGYLNTWFVGDKSGARFSELRVSHEFFNCGHLIQAAIAVARVTGERALLEGACRYADYLCGHFRGATPAGSSGHKGLEPAMVELYRETGHTRYLDFARYLLDWAKTLEMTEVAGHCVETTYLLSGATDYAIETGEPAWRAQVIRLWEDMVAGKLFIHGGIGSRHRREDFGFAFQLPVIYTYAETCAAIGNIHYNQRLSALTGEARYTDLLERTLYNGFLAGVGLSGDVYFYRNVLTSFGHDERLPWIGTSCCLGNAQRMLASVPGYFYSRSDDGLWIHLYDANTVCCDARAGEPIALRVETDYPRSGAVTARVEQAPVDDYALHWRIPAWCAAATVAVNGRDEAVRPVPGAYLELRRVWRVGDRIEVNFDAPPTLMVADRRARDYAGCVAVERGPLLYCLESPDNPDVDVCAARLRLDRGAPGAALTLRRETDLLGDVTVMEAPGAVIDALAARGPLYAPITEPLAAPRDVTLRLIPYYAWANRGPSNMVVWLPTL